MEYIPKEINDVLGNKENREIIIKWILRHTENNVDSDKKSKTKKNKKPDELKNATLISGPCGIGKTLSINLIKNI